MMMKYKQIRRTDKRIQKSVKKYVESIKKWTLSLKQQTHQGTLTYFTSQFCGVELGLKSTS